MTWPTISAYAEWTEKRTAHDRVRQAKRDGLIATEPCEVCGSECDPHAHHTDHADALSIWWLCSSCHAKMHRGTIEAVPDRVRFDPRLFVAWRPSWSEARDCDDQLPIDIDEALGHLRDRERAILIQRVVHGRGLLHIGREHGLSRERVRQIVRNGLDRLAELLDRRYGSLFRKPIPPIAGSISPAPAAEERAA